MVCIISWFNIYLQGAWKYSSENEASLISFLMGKWKYELHSSLGQNLIANLPTTQNSLDITFIFHKVLSGLPCIFTYLNEKVIHGWWNWWLRFYHYCSSICLGQRYGLENMFT